MQYRGGVNWSKQGVVNRSLTDLPPPVDYFVVLQNRMYFAAVIPVQAGVS